MKALVNLNKELIPVHDLPEPDDAEGMVTVRVHHAALNPSDHEIARGAFDWYFRLYGFKGPVRTGLEFAGTVVSGSQNFATGARVFGYPHLFKGPKTHQELLVVPESQLATIPDEMSFAEASAFAVAAQTSMTALRDIAKLTPGQRVLLVGASGGMGLYAIQIAKHLHAHVTAVSGASGQEAMRNAGADEIFDYRRTPVAELKGRFDAILDMSTTLKFKHVRHLLAPSGIFIPAEPARNLLDLLGNPFRKKKTGYLLVDHGDHATLTGLAKMVSNGVITAQKVREFDLMDIEKALEALKQSGGIGRVVLRI